jgi:hypothetical protein
MQIDWRKEFKYQWEQIHGMFHGIHKHLAITLFLMITVAGPVFGAMFIINWIISCIAG